MLAALPAHHDDYFRGALWRDSASRRLGYWLRVASAARCDHRRWSAVQPVIDALYDAGGVSVVRPLGSCAGTLACAETGRSDGRLIVRQARDTTEGTR